MLKKFALVAFIIGFGVIATSHVALANDGHEYAPIQEKKIDYKDWTLKSLVDGKPVNLRGLVKDKKLVLVVYFAQWCPNWRNEAPIVAKLYDKYKANGFEVVAVSEYAAAEDARKYFGKTGAPYTVVVESEKLEDREQTTHFAYRKTSGDKRKWGSPYNIFLEPSKLNAAGDVLIEKAFVVNGELVETEADKFISERLGVKKTMDDKAIATTNIKP